jgi:hypothetical protein
VSWLPIPDSMEPIQTSENRDGETVVESLALRIEAFRFVWLACRFLT